MPSASRLRPGPQLSLHFRRELLEALFIGGALSVGLYGALFLALGRPRAGAAEFIYLVVVILSILEKRRRPDAYVGLVVINLVSVHLLTFTNSVLLGGHVGSGYFLVWGAISPVAALVFLGVGPAVLSGLALGAAWFLVAHFPFPDPIGNALPEDTSGVVGALNLVGVLALILFTLWYFLRRLGEQERAVQSSEANLRAVVDHSPSVIYLEDLAGNYLLVNRRFRELLGIGEGEPVPPSAPKPFAGEEARDPEEPSPSLPLPPRHRSDPPDKVLVREVPYVVPDQGKRTFLVARFPVRDGSGRPAATGCIATDITEQEQLREERIRSQRLESLGVLAGGIAHDFNNVLMAVQGNLGLLQMSGQLWDVSRDALDRINNALSGASRLTRQLLTFSKGGAPVLEATSIGDTIRESVAFVLHGMGADSRVEIPEDLRPVKADAGQVSQVLQNLVLNAVQAMEEGGTVYVQGQNVTAPEGDRELQPGEPYVCITVRDEGKGIPEEVLDHIFEPYFTTRPNGTGLGLASTYSIVRKHRGAIRISSRPGHGTTFRVYLPVTHEQPRQAEPAWATGFRAQGRVLVLDDEPDLRELLRAMLEQQGLEVQAVATGDEAVERYTRALESGRPFHLAILDLTIRGGMGGAEAGRRILARDPRARLVASSGYCNDDFLACHRERGFRAALRKPYGLNELERVVEEVLADPGEE